MAEPAALPRQIADPRKSERLFREADPDTLGELLARLNINARAARDLRWILGELRDDPPEVLASVAEGMVLKLARASFGHTLPDVEAFAKTWNPADPWSEACVLEAIRKLAAQGKPVPEAYDRFINCKAIGRTSFAGLPVLVEALRYLPRPRARAILERALASNPSSMLCAVHAVDAPDLVQRVLAQLEAKPAEFAAPSERGLTQRGLERLPPEHSEALEALAGRVKEPGLAAVLAKVIARRRKAAKPKKGR